MTPGFAAALLECCDATLALIRVRGCVHPNDVGLLARVEAALTDARQQFTHSTYGWNVKENDDDNDRLERLARRVLGRED